jgi:peptide deformylase
MRNMGGIGLSANQVGIKKRAFVMDKINLNEDVNKRDPLVCFNPVVVEELGGEQPGREGCLSYPGLSLQIKRSYTINVRYEDETGKEQSAQLNGINARCFLHELDHLNGIRFTEKVDNKILSWEREKARKLVKKYTKQFAKMQDQARQKAKLPVKTLGE